MGVMVICTTVGFFILPSQRIHRMYDPDSSLRRQPRNSEVNNSSITSADRFPAISERGTVSALLGTKISGARQCQPRTNLMFLKTHKCASSTTQRIFLRYGKKHRLNQVLPLTGNYLGSPPPFKAAMIPRSLRTSDGTYNMMVIHTRLHTPELNKVMKPDAMWVTIVREPVDLFFSLWSYFNLQTFYNMPLEEFASLPYDKVVRWRRSNIYGVHQMFYDLGYGGAEDYGEREMARVLVILNQTFDLVMVAERYDESLVLLKELMCWQTEDVAYLSINLRAHPINLANAITNITRVGLIHLSRPDVQIYDFFARLFQKRVEQFGVAKMAREVQQLQKANQRLAQTCLVDKDDPVISRKNMDWPKEVKHLDVRGDIQECVDHAKTELSILDDVRATQKAWAKQGWPHLARDRG